MGCHYMDYTQIKVGKLKYNSLKVNKAILNKINKIKKIKKTISYPRSKSPSHRATPTLPSTLLHKPTPLVHPLF